MNATLLFPEKGKIIQDLFAWSHLYKQRFFCNFSRWFKLPTSTLQAQPAVTLPDDATVGQTLQVIENDGHQFMPVLNDTGYIFLECS